MSLATPPRCRVCHDGRLIFDVELDTRAASSEVRRFHRCAACGSLMDSASPAIASPTDVDISAHIKHHVGVAANIGFKARQSCLLDTIWRRTGRDAPALLDIGAGIGFGLAMGRARGWSVQGIEPSTIGQAGLDLLDVPIIQDIAMDPALDALDAHSFDIVVATDVIEHVEDPDLFVATAARYLQPDGLLLLTTPDADAAAGRPTARAKRHVYNPGFHLNVLSPAGVVELLERNGFERIEIFIEEEPSGRQRMIVVAGLDAGAPIDSADWDTARADEVAFTRTFLAQIARDRAATDRRDDVYGGALFRLFEGHITSGLFVEAQRQLEQLETLHAARGLDDATFSAVVANDLAEYVDQVPAYAGLYLYYRGLFNLSHAGAPIEALQDFRVAIHLFDIEQAVGYEGRDGWRERALAQAATALVGAGRQGEAVRLIEAALAESKSPPQDAVQDLLHNKGIALLQQRHSGAALGAFVDLLLQIDGVDGLRASAVRHSAVALQQMAEDVQNTMAATTGLLARLDARLNGIQRGLDRAEHHPHADVADAAPAVATV